MTSILDEDDGYEDREEFQPLRLPGPQFNFDDDSPSTPLGYFRLFFNDEVLERLVTATNQYAESKKNLKPYMYRRFKVKALTKEEMMRFLGVLILLGINPVRNYKHVWNSKRVQVRLLSYCFTLCMHIITIFLLFSISTFPACLH